MASTQKTNPQYADEVHIMILEYLIHSTIEAVLKDFRSQAKCGEAPAQAGLTQLKILLDFLLIHQSLTGEHEFDDKVRMWLDLLEVALVICYRDVKFPYLSFSRIPRNRHSLLRRRKHWLKSYRRELRCSDKEAAVYEAWASHDAQLASESNTNATSHAATLFDACGTFFTVSYNLQSYLDHDINQAWADLAAELLLNTAFEYFLGVGDARWMDDPLACIFAWGWIEPDSWDEYFEETTDTNAESELDIAELFEDRVQKTRENETWQQARWEYLSKFEISFTSGRYRDLERAEKLTELSHEFSTKDFEDRMMAFLLDIWRRVRKPFLVQIEEGNVDGLSCHEFGILQARSFLHQPETEKIPEVQEPSPTQRP